jgi:hypothetical protein
MVSSTNSLRLSNARTEFIFKGVQRRGRHRLLGDRGKGRSRGNEGGKDEFHDDWNDLADFVRIDGPDPFSALLEAIFGVDAGFAFNQDSTWTQR